MWLTQRQYKHIPSAVIFAISFANIFLLPALKSNGAGLVYLTTVTAGAVTESFGGIWELGEEAKPIIPYHLQMILCPALSNQIVLLLSHRNKCRQFISHIITPEELIHII